MKTSVIVVLLSLHLPLMACEQSDKPNSDDDTEGATPTPQASSSASSTVDPNFHIFILFGQSNMEGVPKPESQDLETDPNVKVLAYDSCSGVGRTYNQWYTASPPLHSCGAGVGPGDYFAKTLRQAFPDVTIGLVPNAINGVDIDYFRKNVVSSRRSEFRIPPDNSWSGAYEWMLERARLAQEVGVIKGILLHQGESDTGQTVWLDKVNEIVTDLRTDLGIGDVPFLAGELPDGGCCSSHNSVVNQLPSRVTNGHVILSDGLDVMDQYHFDLAGQRELGKRYGEKMVELLSP